MKLHALWWWIDRWRKSTAYTDMTLEEQGAYRNLLDDAALRGGPLPNQEGVLAKACGDPRRWRRVRAAVMSHFTLAEDGWRNATLDEVLRESERRAKNQAAYRQRRGHTSDNGRDNNHDNAAVTKTLTTPLLPSPSPISDLKFPKTKTVRVSPVNGSLDPELGERAGRFCERYAELYEQYRGGARYLPKPTLDWPKACELCQIWDDARLEQLACVFLKTNHDFASHGSRTIGQFAALASWCDDRLRAEEAKAR